MDYKKILQAIPDGELAEELGRRGKILKLRGRRQISDLERKAIGSDRITDHMRMVKRNMVADLFSQPKVISSLEWQNTPTIDADTLEVTAFLIVPRLIKNNLYYELKTIDESQL